MEENNQNGFTLVEVIVVTAVLAILLVLGASLFRGMGRSESRDAARTLFLAGLNNAQTRALVSGEPVALVMTPYDRGREDELGRSFTLFEVRKDEVTGDFIVENQLRRWARLPGRFIFSKEETVAEEGQNAFDQPAVVSVSVRDTRDGSQRMVEMPAIIFGGTGNVVWPAGEGELEIHLTEGVVREGSVFGQNENSNDWRKREVFLVGRQTGRARYLQTQ